jgi:hypothetical protein
MNALAGSMIAGCLLIVSGAALAAPGPKDRKCMVGEERIEGECRPITRGPKNKGAGSS